jgi:hypothetical protein
MRCTFCATGKGGFARNLRTHEIIDQARCAANAAPVHAPRACTCARGRPGASGPGRAQVLAIQECFDRRVSNVGARAVPAPLPPEASLAATRTGCSERGRGSGKQHWAAPKGVLGRGRAARARVSGSVAPRAVFMGMGEPLLNLRAVVAAVRFLNAAVGIGARHITISTVGVPQAIARLAAQRMQATLAVSVHAPSQALRQQLIPRRVRAHAPARACRAGAGGA